MSSVAKELEIVAQSNGLEAIGLKWQEYSSYEDGIKVNYSVAYMVKIKLCMSFAKLNCMYLGSNISTTFHLLKVMFY